MKYPLTLPNKCIQCNENIVAKRSRDLSKIFCGTACVGKFYHTKPKEYTNCLYCNKEFTKTCNTKNMYCSTKCYSDSKIITHIRYCKRCGGTFQLKNIAYERRNNGKDSGKYCSMECGAQFYNWDETYFEKINTEQKAYWLGFIYADGCVDDTEFRLHLSIKDLIHLEKFKNHIGSTHPIHNCQLNTISFNIGNKKIVKDLNKLGVVPRKTFIIEYPKINTKFNRHFIRGVFDGDGCIYVSKKGHKRWSIYTASSKFKDQLSEIIKIDTNITVCIRKQGNGYCISINNRNDIKAIKKYMYNYSTIQLERKKIKF